MVSRGLGAKLNIFICSMKTSLMFISVYVYVFMSQKDPFSFISEMFFAGELDVQEALLFSGLWQNCYSTFTIFNASSLSSNADFNLS